MQQKPTLIGKSLTEMQGLVAALGMPKFAAKQILRWIYVKRVASFDAMTDISAANRALLSEHYVLGRVAPVHEAVSVDGTKKYLFQTTNGLVETVYIP